MVVGLSPGVAGLSATLLLRAVEHLTYHYSFGDLLTEVTGSSPARRALRADDRRCARRLRLVDAAPKTAVPPLAASIANHRPIPRLSLSLDAGLQVLLVVSRASLCREGAPRQFAAVLGDFGTSRGSLTPRDREILLACAAGAGLAAVCSVPVGGRQPRQARTSNFNQRAPLGREGGLRPPSKPAARRRGRPADRFRNRAHPSSPVTTDQNVVPSPRSGDARLLDRAKARPVGPTMICVAWAALCLYHRRERSKLDDASVRRGPRDIGDGPLGSFYDQPNGGGPNAAYLRWWAA